MHTDKVQDSQNRDRSGEDISNYFVIYLVHGLVYIKYDNPVIGIQYRLDWIIDVSIDLLFLYIRHFP